jgi:hypothetical protein
MTSSSTSKTLEPPNRPALQPEQRIVLSEGNSNYVPPGLGSGAQESLGIHVIGIFTTYSTKLSKKHEYREQLAIALKTYMENKIMEGTGSLWRAISLVLASTTHPFLNKKHFFDPASTLNILTYTPSTSGFYRAACCCSSASRSA